MINQLNFDIDLVALLLIGSATVGFLYKKVFKPLYLWGLSVMSSLGKIDAIYLQMYANGGSTLRDAVNRIEAGQIMIEATQTAYFLDSPHGVFKTDNTGKLVTVNRTFCRWLGRSEYELMGHGWLTCIAETDTHRFTEAWEYAMEMGIEFNLVFDVRHADSRTFKVHGKTTPIKAPDGKLLGHLGTIERTQTI